MHTIYMVLHSIFDYQAWTAVNFMLSHEYDRMHVAMLFSSHIIIILVGIIIAQCYLNEIDFIVLCATGFDNSSCVVFTAKVYHGKPFKVFSKLWFAEYGHERVA